MSIYDDSFLDRAMITVAPPFQAVSFDGRDDRGKFVNPYFYPVGEKSMPQEGRELTYLDSQGSTAEEVAKRVKVVRLRAVVDAIRSDARTKKVCEILRHPEATKDLQGHLKMTMLFRMYPAVFDLTVDNRFKFTDRNVAKHQGLLCFDVDKLTPMMLDAIEEEIKNDPYTLVSFLSPRGNGYKWLVRVPASVDDHPLYYDALIDYYNGLFFGAVALDVSCRNINRTIFASHDPSIYVNESAKVWTDKKIPPTPPPRPDRKDFPESSLTEKLAVAVNRVQEGKRSNGQTTPLMWVDGQKHHFLVSLAGMMKGMGVDEQEFRYVASDYIPDRAADKTVSDIFRRR